MYFQRKKIVWKIININEQQQATIIVLDREISFKYPQNRTCTPVTPFFLNQSPVVCLGELWAHPSDEPLNESLCLYMVPKTLDVWLCKFVFQINLSSEVKGILSLPSEQRTPEQVQTVCWWNAWEDILSIDQRVNREGGEGGTSLHLEWIKDLAPPQHFPWWRISNQLNCSVYTLTFWLSPQYFKCLYCSNNNHAVL